MEVTLNAQRDSKKQSSTIFLRLVVIIMGLMALALSSFILPAVYNGWEQEYPTMMLLRYPVLLNLGATLVPFFMALYQTFKLLSYIDTGKAFSMLSVNALGKIKYSAAA